MWIIAIILLFSFYLLLFSIICLLLFPLCAYYFFMSDYFSYYLLLFEGIVTHSMGVGVNISSLYKLRFDCPSHWLMYTHILYAQKP